MPRDRSGRGRADKSESVVNCSVTGIGDSEHLLQLITIAVRDSPERMRIAAVSNECSLLLEKFRYSFQ